jgi:ribonuclease HI
MLEGDSMLIIRRINKLRDGSQQGKVTNNSKFLHPLKNISTVLDNVQTIALSHVRSIVNKHVDSLARLGVSDQGVDFESR